MKLKIYKDGRGIDRPSTDRVFNTLEEASSYIMISNEVIRADAKVISAAKKIMRAYVPKSKYVAWLKEVAEIDKLFI